MIFIFPYIGNNHPKWRTHIFQRGGSTTNQKKNMGHLPSLGQSSHVPPVVLPEYIVYLWQVEWGNWGKFGDNLYGTKIIAQSSVTKLLEVFLDVHQPEAIDQQENLYNGWSPNEQHHWDSQKRMIKKYTGNPTWCEKEWLSCKCPTKSHWEGS